MKRKNNGFTLIELIVVVVILGILIGVTIGGIFGWVKESKKAKGVYVANQLETALNIQFGASRNQKLIDKLRASYNDVCSFCNKNSHSYNLTLVGSDFLKVASWEDYFNMGSDKDMVDIFISVFNEVLPDKSNPDIEDNVFDIIIGVTKDDVILVKVFVGNVSTAEIYIDDEWVSCDGTNYIEKYECTWENSKFLY